MSNWFRPRMYSAVVFKSLSLLSSPPLCAPLQEPSFFAVSIPPACGRWSRGPQESIKAISSGILHMDASHKELIVVAQGVPKQKKRRMYRGARRKHYGDFQWCLHMQVSHKEQQQYCSLRSSEAENEKKALSRGAFPVHTTYRYLPIPLQQ